MDLISTSTRTLGNTAQQLYNLANAFSRCGNSEICAELRSLAEDVEVSAHSINNAHKEFSQTQLTNAQMIAGATLNLALKAGESGAATQLGGKWVDGLPSTDGMYWACNTEDVRHGIAEAMIIRVKGELISHRSTSVHRSMAAKFLGLQHPMYWDQPITPPQPPKIYHKGRSAKFWQNVTDKSDWRIELQYQNPENGRYCTPAYCHFLTRSDALKIGKDWVTHADTRLLERILSRQNDDVHLAFTRQELQKIKEKSHEQSKQ